MSRKGSGVDAVAIKTRYPRALYQKLVASKEATHCRSINRRVMELLVKALDAEEAQKKEVVL